MNKLKYLFLILLTAVLLAGCLGQYLYLTNLTDRLTEKAAVFTEVLRTHDLAAADAALSDFSQFWARHSRRLYSLADHRLVNNIETELAALTEDLHNRNIAQLYSETARLTQAIRTLGQSEQLTLSNLF